LWKIPALIICLSATVGAWLAFGDRGLIDLYSMKMQRQACIERIEQLEKENQALQEELELLSNDMEYVETLIRRKLNLVKENEILYRFGNNESEAPAETNDQGETVKKKD
jgi:cell division protein FtsB